MKLILSLILSLISLNSIFAADIIGKWQTIDDASKQPKSIVEITQDSKGSYNGKIIKLYPAPGKDLNPMCLTCPGALKGQPILGMQIINDLKKEGESFSGGTILDPVSGKTYKCTLKREGEKLSVRGYVGFSLIGRTQTWNPVVE